VHKAILRSALGGQELSDKDALYLLEITSPQHQEEILETARTINERLNGNVVSFVHNMNHNYTNICEFGCKFCNFGKSKYNKEAYKIDIPGALAKIEERGVDELTIQGGLSKEVRFPEVLELLSAIHERFPQIHLHTFSPLEVFYYAEEEECSIDDILIRLKEVGVGSICGTAAEILDDEVRSQICPTKLMTNEWLDVVSRAHRQGLPSTSTILFGHIETDAHIINHFSQIRNLQKETGGITEFIPLRYVSELTRLKVTHFRAQEDSYYLLLLAVARIYFQGTIRNIQASWVKAGLEGALETLKAGVNDLGGTLYEESISRSAGATTGEYTALETFNARLKALGKEPLQRDTLYSYQQQEALVS
jgi:7,8-didemethyl-8-hydroxy-5-deazariboflavin synthase CofH subunit